MVQLPGWTKHSRLAHNCSSDQAAVNHIQQTSSFTHKQTRLTALPSGQPRFLQVNPGSSRSARVLPCKLGSSRSAWVPPGQPEFLQVSPRSSRSTWHQISRKYTSATVSTFIVTMRLCLISFLHFYSLLHQIRDVKIVFFLKIYYRLLKIDFFFDYRIS